MFEGKLKTYYRGFAKSADAFIVASYVNELSGPDELPFATAQLSFDSLDGWSLLSFERDAIVGYTIDAHGSLIALSRAGNILDAVTGEVILAVDPTNVSHFSGITTLGASLILCGDNGAFYHGDRSGFARIESSFYAPLPGADATVQERIQWAQSMRQFHAVERQDADRAAICGAKGTLLHVTSAGISQQDLGLESQITALCADGSDLYFCGHNPETVVGIVRGTGETEILYRLPAGETLVSVRRHQGVLYLADAASGGGVKLLENGNLLAAPFSDVASFGAARHLETHSDILWAVFERALVRFDGKDWDAFMHPGDL